MTSSLLNRYSKSLYASLKAFSMECPAFNADNILSKASLKCSSSCSVFFFKSFCVPSDNIGTKGDFLPKLQSRNYKTKN